MKIQINYILPISWKTNWNSLHVYSISSDPLGATKLQKCGIIQFRPDEENYVKGFRRSNV